MDDPLFPVNLVLRYLHIFGAIALMGGTIFMRFALLPTLQGMDSEKRAEIHQGVRSRWAMVVGLTSGMLLLSGIANLGLASRYKFDMPYDVMSYSMLGGIKLILALPIFVLAALLMGKTDLAKKVQANAATVLNINLLLAVILVLIGGWLKFAKREPKVQPEVPPASAQLILPAGQSLPQAR